MTTAVREQLGRGLVQVPGVWVSTGCLDAFISEAAKAQTTLYGMAQRVLEDRRHTLRLRALPEGLEEEAIGYIPPTRVNVRTFEALVSEAERLETTLYKVLKLQYEAWAER